GTYRLGSANDGVKWNRTEVTAIEGRRLVPVHEEHLTLCDDSTALPEWQCAATPIVHERRARLDAINDDGEPVPTHWLARKGKDALDQRHPEGQITALGEEGRERIRWHGDDEIRDGELADGLNAVQPERHAFGRVPRETRHRLGTHCVRHDGDADDHDDQRCGAARPGATFCLCSPA